VLEAAERLNERAQRVDHGAGKASCGVGAPAISSGRVACALQSRFQVSQHQTAAMPRPLLRPTTSTELDLWSEADALELELGAEGAIRALRARIIEAERDARERLYRLHDEIVRRHPGQDWWTILQMRDGP
jgi:hypothetical protein